MCVEGALVIWYTSPTTPEEREGCKKNTSKTSQNLIANLHPRHFLNGIKFSRIFLVACMHAIAISLSSASQKMLEKKEVGKMFLKLYIHWYLSHWMECGTNDVATLWQNCIILHIVSLSELCDAMSTKSKESASFRLQKQIRKTHMHFKLWGSQPQVDNNFLNLDFNL